MTRAGDIDAPLVAEVECPRPEDHSGREPRLLLKHAGARLVTPLWVFLTPLFLFVALRPDWYNLQNGLDPYFYTGYAQNLDDALGIAGDRHYFVSRWSIYLPNRVFVRLFGAEGGFLLLRFALAIMVVAAIFLLGKGRWRRSTCVLAAVTSLCTPMFVRPLLGDYSDSIAVPFGIVTIVLLCSRPVQRWSAFAAGIAAGLILVANPFGATLVGTAAIAGWLPQRSGWRKQIQFGVVLAVGFVIVVLAGFLLFRWRYGIDNVYQPTVDFLRSGEATGQRTHGLYWLRYRLWIYAPAVTLGMWAYLAIVRKSVFDSAEKAVLRVLALQYALHLVWQFAIEGVTLALPFYWSYVVPSFVLGTVVVIAKLTKERSSRTAYAMSAVIIGVLAVLPSPTPAILHSWLVAIVILAGVCAFVHALVERVPIAALSVFVVFSFGLQLFAPRPEPTPIENAFNPAYETVFHPDHSEGEDAFQAATWFVREMDKFGDPVERGLYFWIGGGHAHRLAAMYEAHVAGRWINPGWESAATGPLEIPASAASGFTGGLFPYVAVIGSPDQVEQVAGQFRALRPDSVILFDAVAPSRLATRVVILAR